jgi:hypothetical protein
VQDFELIPFKLLDRNSPSAAAEIFEKRINPLTSRGWKKLKKLFLGGIPLALTGNRHAWESLWRNP